MASNLSPIIKDIVSSTIETNISTPSPIKSINKCNSKILTPKHIVSIESIFTFEKTDSSIKFIYPAHTASYITNAMMMDTSPPVLEVDEDIADAIKEVTAQISGSIVTALNAENFEELGTVQYVAGEVKIDSGENYEEYENLILLNIETNNDNLELYLHFSDSLLPYVEEFINSEVKEYIEQIPPKENTDEESTEEQDTENQQNIVEENTQINEEDSAEDNAKESEDTEENINLENEDDSVEDKKNKKIKLLIIIIASLLGLVIIAFFVLFFMGTFDEKEVIVSDSNKTKISKRDMLLANIKNKEISYKPSMINVKKLNKRLAILTKYEILEEDILAKYQADEKERLYKLKMSKLEEFALKNKEESLFKKDLINVRKENRFDSNDTNESNNLLQKNVYENTKLILIQINAINYKKYKTIIKNETLKNTSVSICKTENEKIKVYIGPLHLKIVINKIMKKIDSNDAKLITITKKEFDKRCDI